MAWAALFPPPTDLCVDVLVPSSFKMGNYLEMGWLQGYLVKVRSPRSQVGPKTM